ETAHCRFGDAFVARQRVTATARDAGAGSAGARVTKIRAIPSEIVGDVARPRADLLPGVPAREADPGRVLALGGRRIGRRLVEGARRDARTRRVVARIPVGVQVCLVVEPTEVEGEVGSAGCGVVVQAQARRAVVSAPALRVAGVGADPRRDL